MIDITHYIKIVLGAIVRCIWTTAFEPHDVIQPGPRFISSVSLCHFMLARTVVLSELLLNQTGKENLQAFQDIEFSIPNLFNSIIDDINSLCRWELFSTLLVLRKRERFSTMCIVSLCHRDTMNLVENLYSVVQCTGRSREKA